MGPHTAQAQAQPLWAAPGQREYHQQPALPPQWAGSHTPREQDSFHHYLTIGELTALT